MAQFLETMSDKKRRAYENRLETLFEQGKLSSEKWDLLDPIPQPEETDKVAECPSWQIFCYLCGEFY